MKEEMLPKDIIAWRQKMGMSQQKAAEILGFRDRSSICHFETGYRPITPRIARLCKLLMEKHDGKL